MFDEVPLRHCARVGFFLRCIPLRTVLRDSFAINDLTFSFRCFSVLQACVRGENGKFGGTQIIDGGVIACVVTAASVVTGHFEVNVEGEGRYWDHKG